MLFSTPELDSTDRSLIDEIIALRKRLGYYLHQPTRWTGLLRRSALARAIQSSNSIEGYDVSDEDALAAAEGEEPLDAGTEAWAAVIGYRQAMTYVIQLAEDPDFRYDATLLRSLHYMTMSYDLSKHPGAWRPGPIFVRRDATGELVYEGPLAADIPQLIQELVEELNAEDSTPVLVRAAMAHLNLVMVHPFSDGNGRMARCLQSLVLAREGILEPAFCSVEEYLRRRTPDYYEVLASVGAGKWQPDNDSRPWIQFMLRAHYQQAKRIEYRIQVLRIVSDALEAEVMQRGLPERSVLALIDAASGYTIRNSTYRRAAEVSMTVASRDLKALVDAGLLVAKGKQRGRLYVASDLVKEIRRRAGPPPDVDFA